MSAAGGQSDRVVLVTGAASGIGAAVCRRLAAPGLRFLVHTRADKSGLDGTVAAVAGAGGPAEPALGDLRELCHKWNARREYRLELAAADVDIRARKNHPDPALDVLQLGLILRVQV